MIDLPRSIEGDSTIRFAYVVTVATETQRHGVQNGSYETEDHPLPLTL